MIALLGWASCAGGRGAARKAVAAALSGPHGAWACPTLLAGLDEPEPDVRVGFASAALAAACAEPETIRERAERPENAAIRDRLLALLE